MVDINTHEVIASELSLSNVTDSEVLPNLPKQTSLKINEIIRRCYLRHRTIL
ncbi:Mobile element protein [Candidatus Enterovibrio altilux]|uniref:Mobile element protein n=1 Tax=Candidatus Enterovibrio altilux TaxID=1927128 RepID=A0A291B9G8_9GAMM|nr:Mobile element protein [Candidatus Enterovibrio luxaltus]